MLEGEAATKACPKCGETILAVAVLCKHCGSDLTADSRPQAVADSGPDTLGWILLAAPFVATMLVWFWVGRMNLFQSPASALGLIMVGTVVGTALLAAVDAGQLGMGTERDLTPKGKRREGPALWFFSLALLWIIAYPMYLHRRRLYGKKSMVAGGVVVALVLAVSAVAMSAAIGAKAAEVRRLLGQ